MGASRHRTEGRLNRRSARSDTRALRAGTPGKRRPHHDSAPVLMVQPPATTANETMMEVKVGRGAWVAQAVWVSTVHAAAAMGP